jgi:hypothetical protein
MGAYFSVQSAVVSQRIRDIVALLVGAVVDEGDRVDGMDGVM